MKINHNNKQGAIRGPQGFKTFVIFWLSQSISQLGSAMTSFALVVWAYTQTGSAMAVSAMAFCSYLPYIFVSLFAGAYIDSHSKKKIMLASDSAAALCSLSVLLLWAFGGLRLWHIYLVNAVIGCMNAFQAPAQSVAIGKMVPKERWEQACGMDSFSNNLVMVVSPVFASFVFAFGGLGTVIALDLASFLFAFLVLLFLIVIPETGGEAAKKKGPLAGFCEGFSFLFAHRGLWYLVITMAVINFFSRLTYENILSPMILARSGGDSHVLGTVNAVLGIGGIIGGALVSMGKGKRNPVNMVYCPAVFSFLCGDILMAVGKTPLLWCAAGLAASVPIPFISAGQRILMYQLVPEHIQGKVFSARNAVQYCTIPMGILLGGFLADYVFEPFMASGAGLAGYLRVLAGSGTGSGMAVMFLATGILGSSFSFAAYRLKAVRGLKAGWDKDGQERA